MVLNLFFKTYTPESEFLRQFYEGRRNFSQTRIKGRKQELLDLPIVDVQGGVRFDDSVLKKMSLKGAHFPINARGLEIIGTDFSESRLNDSYFHSLYISDSVFSWAEIKDSSLLVSKISCSDFYKAFFNNSDLRYSFSSNSNFNRANFSNSSLGCCTFFGSHFERANFQGASMHGSIFFESDLSCANFQGVVGLEDVEFKRYNKLDGLIVDEEGAEILGLKGIDAKKLDVRPKR